MCKTVPFDELIERYAIWCARANNGGEWATHYDEDQKNFWRKFARDILADYERERPSLAKLTS